MLLHRRTRPSLSSSRLSHLCTTSSAGQLHHGSNDDKSILTTSTLSPSTSRRSEKQFAHQIARLINGKPIPWPTHLSSSLSSFSPQLTRPVVFRALDLIKPPSAALHFFLYVRRLRLPAAPLDARIHFKMLQILCRCRELSPARDFLLSLHTDPTDDTLLVLHDHFFNELIRAHARFRQLRQAVELFRQTTVEFGVPPSVFSYNSLLAALFDRGRTEAARKLFDEMTNPRGGSGVVAPDVCTFNTMIRGCCLNKKLDEGFRWFKEMEKWRCEPVLRTYNTLLDGICRAGKVDIAYNFLTGMKNKKIRKLMPNVVSYTTLIRGYCEKGRVFDALKVFRNMEEEGVEPNSITYNTLIQGLCETGQTEQTKEILARADDYVFNPDICTMNTLITAYCNKGNTEDAMKVFNMIPGLALRPDSATYSVLIRALCEAGDFERAETLLDDLVEKGALLRKRRSTLLMAAYNPILRHLCQNGKVEKAGFVFRLLLRKSTVDRAAFKVLILGYCNEGKIHDGYEILVTMLRRELVPDEETYQALVDGFLTKGDMEFAWKAFEKMLKSGHRPKTATFHSVLGWLVGKGGFVREAGDLVVVMLERKIMQNIDLSTGLVVALYRDGLHGRGLEIVQLLYNKGYSVKMEELVGALCDDRKFFEARDLLLFSVEKHQKLAGATYAAVIQGLCQIGRASDAFKLFYELNEKGRGHIVSDCLEGLEFELEKEGKFKEVEFVHKRRRKHASIDNCKF